MIQDSVLLKYLNYVRFNIISRSLNYCNCNHCKTNLLTMQAFPLFIYYLYYFHYSIVPSEFINRPKKLCLTLT